MRCSVDTPFAVSRPPSALDSRVSRIGGLGTPAYIKLLISENYDELVFTPCNEKEVMSFKVPNQNNAHHMGMRISSKAFVHEVLERNHLDKTKTYAFLGTYMNGQVAIVFPLKPEGQK